MRMTVNEFDSKLTEYVREKLLPSFKNPLYKFIASAAVATDSISVVPWLDKLEMLGIFYDGAIDTDKLDAFVCAGFQAVPSIELVGLRFNHDDYKTFRAMI